MAENNELFGENNTGGLTIKEHLNKYLSYWPFFVISLIVCVAAGMFYLRYTEPKYIASTMIFVKIQAGARPSDLVQSAVNGEGPRGYELDNEMQVIKASPLLQRVVAKNGFNISYYYVGKIRKMDVYLEAPFRLLPQTIPEGSTYFSGTLSKLTGSGGLLEYGIGKNPQHYNFKWNVPFSVSGKVFTLAPKGNLNNLKDAEYVVTWTPPEQTAAEIGASLLVGLLQKNTTILKLDIICTNVSRGKDILNAIYQEFNLADMEDRNIITQNTLRFIDDRLALMARELSGVEGNLQSYQGRNQLINVETQSSQSFANSNTLSQDISGLGVKQGIINMVRNYFNNPNPNTNLVPSTLGLEDPTLSALITQYNELQARKQRETPLVAANSSVMQDLNTQITDTRGNILESLQNLSKNLAFQQSSLQQQNSQYRQFLSALPGRERAMQEIKRKQGITENLYLYLLQKREESAISSTSTNKSNFSQLEPAKGFGQVEPDGTNIKLFSILLGLFLPVGLILLKDMVNDKITSRNDITKQLQIPVLGDIMHLPANKRKGIAVMGRDIAGEQLRIIRTNLSRTLASKDKGVILVTSTGEGEGKSSVSINLAAVLAMPGSKVALLEFDFRKPGVASMFNMENDKGITDYLMGETRDLRELYEASEDIPNLHIFPAGAVGVNPGDLLLNANIKSLFDELKREYDFVVIDSAPTALVSDAFILGQYSDAVVYIIRQRKTLRKQLNFINDVEVSKKLTNISLVFNDVKTGGKYGYYGYGGSYEVYGSRDYRSLNPKKNKKKSVV